MAVKTRDVQGRLVGDARKTLAKAAGSNWALSKAEQAGLSKPLARAADAVRAKKGRVSVDDALDEYKSKLSTVLTAVDKRGKGVLTKAEAQNIYDPALRASVLKARTDLLGVEGPGTVDQAKSAAGVLAAINAAMAGTEVFCESGDHGVNVSAAIVAGQSLAEVLAHVPHDPNAPWTAGELHLTPSTRGTAAAKIASFVSTARAAMEAESTSYPDTIDQFTDGVTKVFSGLSQVHLATGADLGGSYLIGKTSNGYVAVALQAYQD